MEYLYFRVESDLAAPFFIGSSVRGAFGVALKDVVCVNPAFRCEGCFAQENCIYYDLFEVKNRFHLYRLDIVLEPKSYSFGLYLFGKLMEKYPYVLSALHRLFSFRGLGAQRVKSDRFKIWCGDRILYEDGRFFRAQLQPKKLYIDKFCPDIKVKFITPLRIKKQGRFARPETLEIKDVLVSIAKKLSFYNEESVRFGEIPKMKRKDLRFLDLTRYSNRQKTKMRIGGLLGEMELQGVNEDVYRLLKAGEIVGVGKLGTFGLGKIEVEDLV